jgi:hypothetical protein
MAPTTLDKEFAVLSEILNLIILHLRVNSHFQESKRILFLNGSLKLSGP